MDQKEQIQLAFEICDRISRLESVLWGQYYKEFLDIIVSDENAKLNQDQMPLEDVF